MGILIKNGMEIPRACSACIFLDAEHWKCRVCGNASHSADCRPTDCPLSEVPTPHGRLIDADTFENFIRKDWDKNDHWIADVVYSRPTIIPADDKDINVPNKEGGE